MRPVPVLLGLLLTAGLVGTGLVLLDADEPERLSVAPTAPDSPVVQDGDRVRATGSVVSVPGAAVRFCAPVAQLAVGYAPGREPAPAYCAFGVDVEGVDVDEQGPAEPYGQPQPAVAPPCESPAGGWPQDPSLRIPPTGEPEGDVNMDAEQPAMDRYRAEHPGDVVTIALLRPPNSVVMGVSVVDEAAAARAEAALRPAYDQRLCVVLSRYTRAQISAAQMEFVIGREDSTRLGIHGGAGEGVSDALQVEVGYDLVLVTDEIATRAARHPAGLIALRPWLLPA